MQIGELYFLTLAAIPISFVATLVMIAAAKKIGFINRPNNIVQIHKSSIPYGGGFVIALLLILFVLFSTNNEGAAFDYIFILPVITVAGAADDLFSLSPLKKIFVQAFIALPFLLLRIENAGVFFILFFMILIISSQNAWNLIDIMDGLTAGISFFVFLTAGILMGTNGNLEFQAGLSFTIAFSMLGFRFLNRNPAKIFLGETGSLLIGSLFAFFVIEAFQVNKILSFYVLLTAVIPFFEMVFLIIVRTKKGVPFYKGSPDHFALRMLNNGFSINSINRNVLLVCGVNSLIVLISYFLWENAFNLIICVLIIITGAIKGYFYFKSLPARN